MTPDTLMTAPEAATWFTRMRGKKMSRHVIHTWAARYKLPKRPGGYRYGDLLRAEARARTAARETRRVA